ncbi:uncharacterized protein LOC108916086 [Anoplophora glabripennis]|uniref:uncharacterized protein LOC108916086 n=1 Tax=Anoplophora glabripennis TaxID=217634 RepID=UPI0008737EB2|nr:uncharacterized protein LOC108916086 [Anoplophora glabripennis]
MNDNVVKIAEDATKGQSKSSLWYELRYGRITASKIYEAGNCKTSDGTLVETIIGAHKIRETRAMKRGIKLEKEVLRRVEEELKIKLKPCGIILKREYPIFGASPDAIADDFVVEIKCPNSVKALSNYIKDGLIANKYKAQVHLQMFTAQKQKGLFCIAQPDFETSKKINFLWVNFDKDYV